MKRHRVCALLGVTFCLLAVGTWLEAGEPGRVEISEGVWLSVDDNGVLHRHSEGLAGLEWEQRFIEDEIDEVTLHGDLSDPEVRDHLRALKKMVAVIEEARLELVAGDEAAPGLEAGDGTRAPCITLTKIAEVSVVPWGMFFEVDATAQYSGSGVCTAEGFAYAYARSATGVEDSDLQAQDECASSFDLRAVATGYYGGGWCVFGIALVDPCVSGSPVMDSYMYPEDCFQQPSE